LLRPAARRGLAEESDVLPDEKTRLLELFGEPGRWCQGAEARSKAGEPVQYSDCRAAAWDLTGALCFLFGWRRACELFHQLDRHIRHPKREHWRLGDPAIAAMVALQDYNDRRSTTYEAIIERLESMPVWQGHRQVGHRTAPE
jgi:hypothetical protein